MQRYHAGYHGFQSRWNLRIAHIRKVPCAVHLQIVNLRAVGVAHLSGSAAEINDQPARLNSMNGKPMRFEPTGNGGDIFLGNAVMLGELIGSQPFVEIRRLGVVQIVDILVQRGLAFGRPFQLEQHVIQGKAIGDDAAIVLNGRLRAGIAHQPHYSRLINAFANHARGAARRLSVKRGRQTQQPDRECQIAKSFHKKSSTFIKN